MFAMRRFLLCSLAIVIAAMGLTMAIGGVTLVQVGGSWYYLVAGTSLFASAIGLWRGNAWGPRLYAGVVTATLVWAVIEVGLQPWGLLARLGLLVVLGLCMFAITHRRRAGAPG